LTYRTEERILDREDFLAYKGGVKTVRSNLQVLMAQKAQREGKRKISLREVSQDTGISYYTLNAIASETIKEYPKEVLVSLCTYFRCQVGDLLEIIELPDG
jgi:putative transcriptional regulator